MKSKNLTFAVSVASVTLVASSLAAASANATYSLQFKLTCPGEYYTICFPSGVMAIGETDANGWTARYQTDEPERLTVYVGHRHPTNKCSDKDPFDTGVTQRVPGA